MIRYCIHFRATRWYQTRFFGIGCLGLFEVISVFGKRSSNLAAFGTYHAAQPPGPRCDLVYQIFLAPTFWLKVFNNFGVTTSEALIVRNQKRER
jgi:hypothetical protein